MSNQGFINLAQGAGGQESQALIKEIRGSLSYLGGWNNIEDDGAVFNNGDWQMVFTTDSFIVDPIFFPGGDIGKLSFCGTVNDLAVMGADVLGISLSLIIEEGFSKIELKKIIKSINDISLKYKVPIVTGDTKVTDKGKLDKIIINTAGVGRTKKIIPQQGIKEGDVVIVSGSLGDHEVALLSKRFNYQTNLVSDCAPLIKELVQVRAFLKACKDPTRGGLASIICEIAQKNKKKIILEENLIPFKKETKALCNLLGLDPYFLASEGRLVAVASKENKEKVLQVLKSFNPDACEIGSVTGGQGVFINTVLGQRQLFPSLGKNVPRIC